MKKVLVLGTSGMLGAMVTDYLSKKEDIELSISLRSLDKRFYFSRKYKNIKIIYLDFKNVIDYSIFDNYLIGYDYIINCIGITKPMIDEKNFNSIRNAIEINSILPYYLKSICERNNIILIQILTDCVFSGKTINCYEENDIKDAFDIYGKSKIMGEYISNNVINLRTSIIGPEIDSKKFFLEWFLQNEKKEVEGYDNHYWNGITTLAFVKIIYAIIKNKEYMDSVNLNVTNKYIHLHSFSTVNKSHLLHKINEIFEKNLIIKCANNKEFINRKLISGCYQKESTYLWMIAGYEKIPGIEFLLEELKEYMEKEWTWKKML